MIVFETIRHAVSVSGKVSDALSGFALAGAWVEIVTGPADFEDERATLSAAPGWDQMAQRIDRTFSQADGSYAFIDLPAGTYQLKVSLPQAGRRYGSLAINNVAVSGQRDSAGRVQIALADAALTPTQVQGSVTRQDNNQPIAGASIGLRGDTHSVLSDANGHYLLRDLDAVSPTVTAAAANFKPFSQAVNLTPGAALNLNIVLVPA